MSRPGFCFGTENLLRRVGYSPCGHHKIDCRNDDLALGNEIPERSQQFQIRTLPPPAGSGTATVT